MKTSSESIAGFEMWGEPERVMVNDCGDRIELIYKEVNMVTYFATYPSPVERVFKIVCSCKDGKWHRSKRIYGEIIKQRPEEYIFEVEE